MKNRNFVTSFNNAIDGILYAVKHERNMKVHITAGGLVILLSLFYNLTRVEFVAVCLTVGLVIVCELFNTAVEVLVDIIVDIYHPRAKIIKDVAAGAVLVSAVLSLVVAYLIFFDRLTPGVEMAIKGLMGSSTHLTVVALGINAILIIGLKIFFRTGTHFSGGMPSGHSALAISLATAISFITGSGAVAVLCFMISLLVIQSRIEAKIHSILEVAGGAAVGFLVTLLVFQLL